MVFSPKFLHLHNTYYPFIPKKCWGAHLLFLSSLVILFFFSNSIVILFIPTFLVTLPLVILSLLQSFFYFDMHTNLILLISLLQSCLKKRFLKFNSWEGKEKSGMFNICWLGCWMKLVNKVLYDGLGSKKTIIIASFICCRRTKLSSNVRLFLFQKVKFECLFVPPFSLSLCNWTLGMV